MKILWFPYLFRLWSGNGTNLFVYSFSSFSSFSSYFFSKSSLQPWSPSVPVSKMIILDPLQNYGLFLWPLPQFDCGTPFLPLHLLLWDILFLLIFGCNMQNPNIGIIVFFLSHDLRKFSPRRFFIFKLLSLIYSWWMDLFRFLVFMDYNYFLNFGY